MRRTRNRRTVSHEEYDVPTFQTCFLPARDPRHHLNHASVFTFPSHRYAIVAGTAGSRGGAHSANAEVLVS